MLLRYLPVLVPLALVLGAVPGFARPGARPGAVPRVAALAAVTAFGLAAAAMALLVTHGPATVPLLGWRGFGLSFRLDAVSAAMAMLVTFTGWVVARYAAGYLDGEPRKGVFVT